ncbi:hypothetical protein [Variovorax boronicumulans]|uniref:hypothetical protein n=1 Tax=Variovorax boronicumulans TaxID=436515 RepID=UPI0012E43435|nr:hypothetical protein [Variovorax boronicumulans]GER16687.1 hypothetical protein VCH24_16930 [Variovorax boronicumulans]
MQLIPWIPAITTTALLALSLWLFKLLVSNRVAKSVQYEFDKKIEAVRTELRASEERLKAQLREKEAEIAALRGGALSGLVSRQAALDKRRLEAVDQIWSALNALEPARGITRLMSAVKFEAAAARSPQEPNLRAAFKLMENGFDPASMDLSGAAKARPFVSPMVWAVYSAILAINMHSVVRLKILQGGLDSKLVDNDGVEKLIVAVLPWFADVYKTHGPDVYYTALDALDTKLISELQNMLTGADSDKATVARAAEIIRDANALQASTTGGEMAAEAQSSTPIKWAPK